MGPCDVAAGRANSVRGARERRKPLYLGNVAWALSVSGQLDERTALVIIDQVLQADTVRLAEHSHPLSHGISSCPGQENKGCKNDVFIVPSELDNKVVKSSNGFPSHRRTHAVREYPQRNAGYDCEKNATVRQGQGMAAETTPPLRDAQKPRGGNR